jgi:hypothetical protein
MLTGFPLVSFKVKSGADKPRDGPINLNDGTGVVVPHPGINVALGRGVSVTVAVQVGGRVCMG